MYSVVMILVLECIDDTFYIGVVVRTGDKLNCNMDTFQMIYGVSICLILQFLEFRINDTLDHSTITTLLWYD